MSRIRRWSGLAVIRIAIVVILIVSAIIFAANADKATASGQIEETPFMTIQRDGERPQLFDLIGLLKTQSSASVAAVREQEVNIKFKEIDFSGTKALKFPLLDGRSYEAVRNEQEGFERFAADEFTWRGKIFGENDFSGDVILSVKDRSLSGLIYSPTAVYEIVPQADFRHLLVELDQNRFPSCGGPIQVDESSSESDNKSLGLDDGSQIDVLVTYTALLRQALGGTTQAQAFAQQAIASTNTAYQNSDIAMRVRLVGTLEVSYDEAAGTLSAALPWSRNDPETAAVRDIVKADMVSIIIQNASDACGIGYLMTNVGPSFASSAFSAASRSCAVGNLTFAHELGHNQAAHHNPENAGSAAFPYAYGHYVNASFRTVMSYVNQCPKGCSRVPYFSNPAISFNGSPTGITDERDNHRTLNNTALTISQFRDGLVATLTPTNTPTPTNTATPSATSTLTSTATNTPTATPTPLVTPSISGTVTYGNAAVPPKFISNVNVNGAGLPGVFTTTAPPGSNAGQYMLTGFGAGSYNVSLSKSTGQNGITSLDAALISQHVAGVSILSTDIKKVSADVSANNTISSNDAALLAAFAAGLSQVGIANQWRFYVSPGPIFSGPSPTIRSYSSVNGNLTGEDFVGLLIGDISGNWTPSALRLMDAGQRPGESNSDNAVSVKLPNVVSSDNKETIVPVNIKGIANKNVISYEFDLRYDPSVIQPFAEPVDVTGTASRGLMVVTNTTEPGLLKVVMYGPMPIDRDGVLLNLRFTAVGASGSMSPLTWERIMFNEGEPGVNALDGQIILSSADENW